MENNQNSGEQILVSQPFEGSGLDITANTQENENMIAGIVGAFLFSLIGALLWFAFYQLNIIASLCGLVTVVCAMYGYRLFAKADSLKGIIIAAIISVLMIAAAEYTCVAYEIYKVYKQDFKITFFDAFRSTYSFISSGGEILGSVLKDLLIGYILGAVGSFSYIKNAVRANKLKQQQGLL